MIVVADSGPLHYLVLLDYIDLLQRFYSRVVVPEAVASELAAAGAPPTVRDWILQPPAWVTVVPVALEAVETITAISTLANAQRSHWRQPSAPISS
jgi:predicted nucleic acid-binding protein